MTFSSIACQVLIFAVTISLFTELRISFFGLGEILILLVFLSTLVKPTKLKHLGRFIFAKFWLGYICLSMLGLAMNAFVLKSPTGTFEQMIFDLAAYVFVFIACFTFEKMYFEGRLDPRKFLTALFYFSGSVLASLYLLGFFTSSLFGFSLRYYDHFAPLVENVHQVSMYLVVLPFIGSLIVFARFGVVRRMVAAILVVAAVAMSFGAATTKADLAILVGAVVLTYGYTLRVSGKGYILPVNMICIAAILGMLFWIDAGSLFSSFFMEADPHGAREQLYSRSLSVIADSPIFGHGPGPHVLRSGRFWDVHQTHLAILLQAGLLGLILYSALLVKMVRRIWTSPALLAAFAAIFTYSAGGDILRRLPIWILLLLIYYWNDPNRDIVRLDRRTNVGHFSAERV